MSGDLVGVGWQAGVMVSQLTVLSQPTGLLISHRDLPSIHRSKDVTRTYVVRSTW